MDHGLATRVLVDDGDGAVRARYATSALQTGRPGGPGGPRRGPARQRRGGQERPREGQREGAHRDAADERGAGPVEEHDVGQHRRPVGPQVERRGRARRPGVPRQRAVEHPDHEHGDDQPARVVRERHAGHERQRRVRVGPGPVAGVDHLRVEEQVPGGQCGAPGEGDRRDRPPPGQGPADDERGPGHHRPGQRDNGGDAEHRCAEAAGVGVGAERQAGVYADRLDKQAAAAGHGEQDGGAARAVHPGRVADRGGAEDEHRDDRHRRLRRVGDQRVHDLDEHRGTGEHPRQRGGQAARPARGAAVTRARAAVQPSREGGTGHRWSSGRTGGACGVLRAVPGCLGGGGAPAGVPSEVLPPHR